MRNPRADPGNEWDTSEARKELSTLLARTPPTDTQAALREALADRDETIKIQALRLCEWASEITELRAALTATTTTTTKDR
jgi:hypothetical protein